MLGFALGHKRVSGVLFLLLGFAPERTGRRLIKRLKGMWWMPWYREAMKDVARCEKPWGAASKL